MCAVRDELHLMSVMACKANVGHTEPAAGVTGLLQTMVVLHASVNCPNAQLRIMNPHVVAAFNGCCPSLALELQNASFTEMTSIESRFPST